MPLWSVMEATLCIRTCLWLTAAAMPLLMPNGLAHSAELEPGAETWGKARGSGELTWAVSLNVPEGAALSEEELVRQADDLARTAGLVNVGRVGELRGHYLFAYQPAGRMDQKPEAVRRAVEALFAQHDSVRWHSEQKLLKRSKRSLHFNDPKYPEQWHLVSALCPGHLWVSLQLTGGLAELAGGTWHDLQMGKGKPSLGSAMPDANKLMEVKGLPVLVPALCCSLWRKCCRPAPRSAWRGVSASSSQSLLQMGSGDF